MGRNTRFLAVLALAAACRSDGSRASESPFRSRLQSLKAGMTRREVQAVLPPLGGDSDRLRGPGSYVLVYSVSADWIVELPFRDAGAEGHGQNDLLAAGTARLVRKDRRPPEHVREIR